jgi:hypothetical protein
MGSIALNKGQRNGRTTIRIAVTPKSAATRALLRQFKAEVSRFEKKWKALALAAKKKKKSRRRA